MTLKEARKEAREHLLESGNPYWEYISYRKEIGFYYNPSILLKGSNPFIRRWYSPRDMYTVFRVDKSGRTCPVLDTDYSWKFHRELMKIRKKRNK